jgi:hypothetical protein
MYCLFIQGRGVNKARHLHKEAANFSDLTAVSEQRITFAFIVKETNQKPA